MNDTVNGLFSFINSSPTAFHTVDTTAKMLEKAGFCRLWEQDAWQLCAGGRYYTVRSGSSLIAFRIPGESFDGFQISAAHSDTPCFKLKDDPQKKDGVYVRLNTEKYGGMLLSTWLDRPLGVAGRVMLSQDGKIVQKLVDSDCDLAVIPNVAIHMMRNANDGLKLLPNVDMVPICGLSGENADVLQLFAQKLGVCREDILAHDLYLYNRQRASLVGMQEELICAPRLDDLTCVYGCLTGFLEAEKLQSCAVCCVFDNEEVGSHTAQGAASTFLSDVLQRISEQFPTQQLRQRLARSFMLSADNAHAVHPNHPELSDGDHAPKLNGGVVVKFNAAQHYTTDALSAAVFRGLCRTAGVPVQSFCNRSDLPGGSTLGNIATSQVSVRSADIGLAQLAMHSAMETAGARDPELLVRAVKRFFESRLLLDGDCAALV